jgi:hypothetical protein
MSIMHSKNEEGAEGDGMNQLRRQMSIARVKREKGAKPQPLSVLTHHDSDDFSRQRSPSLRSGINKNKILPQVAGTAAAIAADRALKLADVEFKRERHRGGGFWHEICQFLEDPFDRKSDVYVKVTLFPWNIAHSTHTVSNINPTENIEFGESFIVGCPANDNEQLPVGTPSMLMQLWDADSGYDDLIGEASVAVGEFMENPGLGFTIESSLTERVEGRCCGKLRVDISYNIGKPPNMKERSTLGRRVWSGACSLLQLEESQKRKNSLSNESCDGYFNINVCHCLGVKKGPPPDHMNVTNDKTTRLKAIGISLLYFTIGALFYKLAEEWTIIDGVYFSIVCITTVGYGDLLPKHPGSKVFTMIYVSCGTTLIVTSLTYLLGTMMDKQMVRMHNMQTNSLIANKKKHSIFKSLFKIMRTCSWVSRHASKHASHSLHASSSRLEGHMIIGCSVHASDTGRAEVVGCAVSAHCLTHCCHFLHLDRHAKPHMSVGSYTIYDYARS